VLSVPLGSYSASAFLLASVLRGFRIACATTIPNQGEGAAAQCIEAGGSVGRQCRIGQALISKRMGLRVCADDRFVTPKLPARQ
jgi:hypothetical protein